jgi:hypothetical protein
MLIRLAFVGATVLAILCSICTLLVVHAQETTNSACTDVLCCAVLLMISISTCASDARQARLRQRLYFDALPTSTTRLLVPCPSDINFSTNYLSIIKNAARACVSLAYNALRARTIV